MVVGSSPTSAAPISVRVHIYQTPSRVIVHQDFAGSPYKHLLDEPQVRRWLENAERGSPIMANDYLRQIGKICQDLKTTPQRLSKMNERQASEFLSELVSFYETKALENGPDKGRKGLKSSTIHNYIKAVKSWWMFTSGLEVKRKIKLKREDNKYENEVPPSKPELQQVFDHADVRGKVAISLMSFCGFRDETLGNFLGDDGLRVGDLSELKVKDGVIEFKKTPTLVKVRKTLSKTGNPYFVFLPEQGCAFLKEYLEWRARSGEALGDGSAIITDSRPSKLGVTGHIRTPVVGRIVRRVIREAGFGWRPYIFRRYFDVRMMEAEANGLVINDWRRFFMGHKGNIEATYTVNKGLSEETQEEMREAYAKAAAKYLSTSGREEKRDIRTELARQLLLISGFKPEEVDSIDLGKMKDEEIQEAVRHRLLGVMANNGNHQKVIPVAEVDDFISRGWEFVAALPKERAVLRLPN